MATVGVKGLTRATALFIAAGAVESTIVHSLTSRGKSHYQRRARAGRMSRRRGV